MTDSCIGCSNDGTGHDASAHRILKGALGGYISTKCGIYTL